MSDNTNSSNEPYELEIGNTTFQITSRYIGDQSFLDLIKSALIRDIEANSQNNEIN